MRKMVLVECIVDIAVVCSECEDSVHTREVLRQLQEYPRPNIPYDWNVVNGRAYCSKHVITIETKEERDMRAKTNLKAGIVGGQPATDGQ